MKDLCAAVGVGQSDPIVEGKKAFVQMHKDTRDVALDAFPDLEAFAIAGSCPVQRGKNVEHFEKALF